MTTVTFVHQDNGFQAIYVNGELATSDNDIQAAEALRSCRNVITGPYEFNEVTVADDYFDWDSEDGNTSYPRNLSDLRLR